MSFRPSGPRIHAEGQVVLEPLPLNSPRSQLYESSGSSMQGFSSVKSQKDLEHLENVNYNPGERPG